MRPWSVPGNFPQPRGRIVGDTAAEPERAGDVLPEAAVVVEPRTGVAAAADSTANAAVPKAADARRPAVVILMKAAAVAAAAESMKRMTWIFNHSRPGRPQT